MTARVSSAPPDDSPVKGRSWWRRSDAGRLVFVQIQVPNRIDESPAAQQLCLRIRPPGLTGDRGCGSCLAGDRPMHPRHRCRLRNDGRQGQRATVSGQPTGPGVPCSRGPGEGTRAPSSPVLYTMAVSGGAGMSASSVSLPDPSSPITPSRASAVIWSSS